MKDGEGSNCGVERSESSKLEVPSGLFLLANAGSSPPVTSPFAFRAGTSARAIRASNLRVGHLCQTPVGGPSRAHQLHKAPLQFTVLPLCEEPRAATLVLAI